MKRIGSLIAVLFCGIMIGSVCIAGEEKISKDIDQIMPLSKIKQLFPEYEFTEDGYIEEFRHISNNSELQGTNQIITSPVEIRHAKYKGGECTLQIYCNGQYGVLGVEQVDDIGSTKANPGWETYGSKYRSYYRFSLTGFFYTYNKSSTSFSNLSSPTQPLPNSDPYWTFSAGSTGGNNTATVYGYGYFTYKGGATNGFKLITHVSGGSLTVSIQAA